MSWLADHIEHANLMGVKFDAGLMCQTWKDELGLLIHPPDLESHHWNSAAFKQKCREYQNAKSVSGHQLITISKEFVTLGDSP